VVALSAPLPLGAARQRPARRDGALDQGEAATSALDLEGDRMSGDGPVLTIFVIYKEPSDYPGKWVIREQRIKAGSVEIMAQPYGVFDDLLEARDAIPIGLYQMPRQEGDHPDIFECWI
jgi:hypothetical protein